jgi:hypothetical protein
MSLRDSTIISSCLAFPTRRFHTRNIIVARRIVRVKESAIARTMTCVKEGGPGEVSAWLSGVVELVVSEVVVSEVVVREVVVSEVVASEVVASEVGPGCIVTMIADETLSDGECLGFCIHI